jgi:hypothetical protein
VGGGAEGGGRGGKGRRADDVTRHFGGSGEAAARQMENGRRERRPGRALPRASENFGRFT